MIVNIIFAHRSTVGSWSCARFCVCLSVCHKSVFLNTNGIQFRSASIRPCCQLAKWLMTANIFFRTQEHCQKLKAELESPERRRPKSNSSAYTKMVRVRRKQNRFFRDGPTTMSILVSKLKRCDSVCASWICRGALMIIGRRQWYWWNICMRLNCLTFLSRLIFKKTFSLPHFRLILYCILECNLWT